jgi:predicted MFS family arabinose efflux permease
VSAQAVIHQDRQAPTEPDPRRWSALVVIAVAQLMIALDATIVSIALPSAQAALGASDANRQWVITAYTLAFGGLLLLGGRIADYMGRKRAFLLGLGGFAVASVIGGARQHLRCSSQPGRCRAHSRRCWPRRRSRLLR